jgi:membrane-associated phospholipid phosphatase
VSHPLSVAAWGWLICAALLSCAVAAVVIGHRRLREDPARLPRWWGALGLLVATPLAIFVVLAGIVVRGTPAWDTTILHMVARHQGHLAVVRVVSTFGSVQVVCVLLALTLGLLLGARLNRQATFVAAATLASMAASGIMKVVIARPRPEVVRQAPGSWSFPSGHTMSATGFAVALAIVLWPTRWRWPALAVAVFYAVGIGLSRVYLAVHYPSDVVGGWALSLAVVGLVWLLFWDRLDVPPGLRRRDTTLDWRL